MTLATDSEVVQQIRLQEVNRKLELEIAGREQAAGILMQGLASSEAAPKS
jgi:hypothetical protein